jgi:hypothetical protein
MAEAEALARRLTDAEGRLRRLQGPAPAQPAPADPADAPAVLEARADLLSDEARRLGAEAALLDRAAGQLRSRQTLRRRAGQIERDPFAAVEAPKRQMLIAGPRQGTAAKADNSGERPAADPAPAAPPRDPAAPESGPAVGTTAPAPPKSSPGFAPPAPTGTKTPEATQPPPPRADTLAPPGPSPSDTVALPPASPIVRALIDPAALAELRRAEAAGRTLSEPEKMARAAAALRARVQALEAEAAALRARAARR